MRRFLVISLVAGVVSFASIAGPASASTASISLKPNVGPPTSKVTVTGSGFGVSEVVHVVFDAQPPVVVSTDTLGSFTATVVVPRSALPGPSHSVTATGLTSGSSASTGFTVRTDWAMAHFDAASAGANPYENVLGSNSLPSTSPAWTAPAASGTRLSSPVVAGGKLFADGTTGLEAFDAAGVSKCSHTPLTCRPLWVSNTIPDLTQPVVANGVVYVKNFEKVYAFSAAGTTNCQVVAKVKTCEPVWTTQVLSETADSSALVVASHVVYDAASNGTLFAFNGTATSACTGTTTKVCPPIWTATISTTATASTPAVAKGVVYVGSSDGNLYAFDAKGVQNCQGAAAARTCAPLWTGGLPGSSSEGIAPAVVNNSVYVANNGSESLGAVVSGFSANGTTNCHVAAGVKTCTPVWQAGVDEVGIVAGPAVANGVLFVTDSQGYLQAYSTNGSEDCSVISGVTTCTPLWSTAQAVHGVAPSIANGLVYIGAFNTSTTGQLAAYRATENPGCPIVSGVKTCAPVWTSAVGSGYYQAPAIVNGTIYDAEGNTLNVFR